MLSAIYPIAIFISAALLFAIQPYVGKLLLPTFGGTPAVWTGCLFFFQGTLLLGYLYAHLIGRFGRKGGLIHLLLLIAVFGLLPLASRVGEVTTNSPLLSLLVHLTVNFGPVAFLLSATSPLLQRWFSLSSTREPYWLYRASNAGSFLGLFSYPLIFERYCDLGVQSKVFTLLYLGFAVCVAALVFTLRVDDRVAVAAKPDPVRFPGRVVLLSALGSTLLFAVTAHLATSIAAIPFLWTIPLGVYLLSFIIAFREQQGSALAVAQYLAPHAILLCSPFLFFDLQTNAAGTILIHSLLLGILVTLLHRRLYNERPAESGLTTFYLYVALGGVVGGVLNAIVAPNVFNVIAEYPIAVMAAVPLVLAQFPMKRRDLLVGLSLSILLVGMLLAYPVPGERSLPTAAGVFYAAGALTLFAFRGNPKLFGLCFVLMLAPLWLIQTQRLSGNVLNFRNFYGVKRVVEREGRREFIHAGTVHGVVMLDDPLEPAAYFSRLGPVGDIFNVLRERSSALDISVVGLGIGSMLSYAVPEDKFIAIELDPQVAELASRAELFPYVSHCGASCRIVVGDGRLELERDEIVPADAIFLDAFTSDSIPLHLLSKEAIQLYLRKLKASGLIVFNISNRFFDLRGQLALAGESLGLVPMFRANHDLTSEARQRGAFGSVYLILIRDKTLQPAFESLGWKVVSSSPGTRLWTDSFSSLLDARM